MALSFLFYIQLVYPETAAHTKSYINTAAGAGTVLGTCLTATSWW